MWKTLAMVVWIGLLCGLTAVRSQVWTSSPGLWKDALAKSPTKPRVLINYGEIREADGDLSQALSLYVRAYHATRTRHDQRALQARMYVLADLVRRLTDDQRMEELWTVLAESGCRPSWAGKQVTWDCTPE